MARFVIVAVEGCVWFGGDHCGWPVMLLLMVTWMSLDLLLSSLVGTGGGLTPARRAQRNVSR